MALNSRKQHVIFLFLAASAFLLGTHNAIACSCGPGLTVLDTYDRSDVVIIARAISVEIAPPNSGEGRYVDGVHSTTMVVERVFKGKLKVRDEIVFGQGGGADCIWTFSEKSVGEQFLFYLGLPGKPTWGDLDPGLWYAGGCGRSSDLGGAKDDLLYLENITKQRGRTRISGTIGGWQNPDLAVDRRRIRIIGEKKTYETKTDEDGVFEIYDLPPGKYLVEPETPPGWKINPYWLWYSPSVVRKGYREAELKSPNQVVIVLEPGKHAGVDIVFTIDNVIRGQVKAPDGKPMHGVCLNLASWAGDWGGGSDCTDEKGSFEIGSIPEGQYVLVANKDGKISSLEPFTTFFYPGVSERARAAVFSIGAGDVIKHLIVIVPELKETVTVQGAVRYSDGKPAVEEWVKFKPTNPDSNISGGVSVQTDSAGRFSMKVLKGLTGELAAEDWLMEGLFVNCPEVDELIKKSGGNNTTVKTNAIEIRALHDFENLDLRFPFPLCQRATE